MDVHYKSFVKLKVYIKLKFGIIEPGVIIAHQSRMS